MTTNIDTVLKSISEVGTRLDKVEAEAKHANAGVTELAQKSTSMGVQGAGTVKTKSFAEKVAEEISANAEIIAKSGNVTLKIKGAFNGITSASAPATVSGTISAPEPYALGLQHALSVAARPAEAQHYLYSKFKNSWTNDVGVVAELGDRAWVTPSFEKKSQDAIILSALSEISDQAVFSAPELSRVIELVLHKSLAIQTDALLWNGHKVAGAGAFDGLSKAAKTKTSTFTQLADAISDGVNDLAIIGLQPTSVVLHPNTWLALETATDLQNRYLSGEYLQPLTRTIRGLPVNLSVSVPQGKALILDNRFVELGVIQDATVTLGYVNTQFATGSRSIRIDQMLSPAVYQDEAMLLVTPKAAA